MRRRRRTAVRARPGRRQCGRPGGRTPPPDQAQLRARRMVTRAAPPAAAAGGRLREQAQAPALFSFSAFYNLRPMPAKPAMTSALQSGCMELASSQLGAQPAWSSHKQGGCATERRTLVGQAADEQLRTHAPPGAQRGCSGVQQRAAARLAVRAAAHLQPQNRRSCFSQLEASFQIVESIRRMQCWQQPWRYPTKR